MKYNKILLLITIASLTTLASCDNSTSSSSISSSSFSDVIEQNIYDFSKGFLMKGNISQTRYVAIGTDSNGDYIFSSDASDTNSYKTNIGFENKTRNGYTKYSTQEYDFEDQVIENYTYFEDENGYTYKESLNCKNEIERDYTINQSKNSFTYNGFYNFFSILNREDFEKENDTTYYINIDKASIISNNLLYSLNSGFSTNVKEAYFNLTNGVFTSFTIEMNDYLYLDSSTYYLYKVENKAVFSLEQAGTYTIDSAKKYDSKGYTTLQNSLSSIGNNFTMHVEIKANNQVDSSSSTSYEDFYFTGDKIYVHTYDNLDSKDVDKTKDFYLSTQEDGKLYSYSYDETSSSFIKQATTNFPSLYQGLFTYNDYLPNIKDVSADLFKYDDQSKTYKGEDNAISALTDCFYLKKVPFKKSAANSFYDIEISLDNDKISLVTLPYSYTDFMEGSLVTGTYKISYSNIGSTSLPL